MKQNKTSSAISMFLICILQFFILSEAAQGQIRAGSAFLKMLPGARLQAMASSHTSMIDDPHAFFANPGASGFLREFQWSASYSKWIADMYNASFIYGRKFRTPWARRSLFSVGILYYGVPEFDSTDEAAPASSAQDLVVAFSAGQPLSFLAENVSLGANVKYLKSTLDQFDASSLVFDLGILGRTPRISLGNSLFNYGILSGGVALTQLGQDLKFDRTGTPLPKTLRYGASLYLGTHNGLQVQFLADYHQVKDEDDAFGVGAEFSWGSRFSFNGGYNTDSDLMDKITFGIGIRLDDLNVPEKSLLPGRNNALRLDIATLDEGEFFSRTYRGSMTHLPLGPESFQFIEPACHDTVLQSEVTLRWEKSREPDLYDDVRYTLFYDRDSTRLAEFLSQYDETDNDRFISILNRDTTIRILSRTNIDTLQLSNLESGDHYWAVVAQDMDSHTRFAEAKGTRISHFYVPYPDLEIEKIEHDFDKWITMDDYHGDLKVHVWNKGNRAAENAHFSIIDSVDGDYFDFTEQETGSHTRVIPMSDDSIRITLEPGERRVLTFPWHTDLLGAHSIAARVEIMENEPDISNNALKATLHTIPKGSISSPDSVLLMKIAELTLDVPLISEVCFGENQDSVSREYWTNGDFEPPLLTLSKRLKENRAIKIALKGFTDVNTDGKDLDLAMSRVRSVRDLLISELGVDPSQIDTSMYAPKVTPGRRVSSPRDAKWFYEEQRRVEIHVVDNIHQEELFRPVTLVENESHIDQVNFIPNIHLSVPATFLSVYCTHDDLHDSLHILNPEDQLLHLSKDIPWAPETENGTNWLNKNVAYNIGMTDEQGRTFYTRDRNVFLDEKSLRAKHRIAFPLQFADTSPIYNFYWNRVFEQIDNILTNNMNSKIYFEGHACAIGRGKIGRDGRLVNESLSDRRVKAFYNGFQERIKNNPDVDRINALFREKNRAIGIGDSKPLRIIKPGGGEKKIGNNESAIGRKLNRRIEIVFDFE